MSTEDLERDPEWRFAPVGVISHVERDVINLYQLEAFARHFGLPLVKWRCRMVDEIDDRALRDDLYADEPNLWQYFVEVRRVVGWSKRGRHGRWAGYAPNAPARASAGGKRP